MNGSKSNNGMICVIALVCVAIMVSTSLCCLGNATVKDDTGSHDVFVGEKERCGEYLVKDNSFKKDGLIYEIEDDSHVMVADYDGGYRNIVVPNEVENNGHTYTVDKIAKRGLSVYSGFGRHPWTVEIGPTVEVIGESGVSNQPNELGDDNYTKEFTIRDVKSANLRSIGAYAFDCCQIASLVLPASVKVIESHAFYMCNVSSVNLNSVEFIGSHAFDLTRVANIDLDSAKVIEDNAFSDSPIRSVHYGSSIQEIGESFIYRNYGYSTSSIIDAAGKSINPRDVDALRGHTYTIREDGNLHEVVDACLPSLAV